MKTCFILWAAAGLFIFAFSILVFLLQDDLTPAGYQIRIIIYYSAGTAGLSGLGILMILAHGLPAAGRCATGGRNCCVSSRVIP